MKEKLDLVLFVYTFYISVFYSCLGFINNPEIVLANVNKH